MDSKKAQLIVECNLSLEEQNLITKLGQIKYKLPSINSCVIEIDEKNLDKIKDIKSIKRVHQNTHITTQMYNSRKIVNVNTPQENGILGKNVTIAILDTGISPLDDFTKPYNRIIAFKDFINNKQNPYDDNGHGTHVAGISGGNGYYSKGKYKGIAPECNFVGVKVLDDEGQGNSSDVLAGIQWVLDNKDKYSIRVLNLSIGTSNSSLDDPLIKAVEKVWDEGIVVTIAAGNNGPSKQSITSPAISKKIITIGASDDHKSTFISGASLINFSGRGPTLECVIKPDVVAPGVNIISCLSDTIKKNNKDIIDENYFALSGTSMSTPMVAGAIALLLEKHPHLTPNEVKLMLKKSSKNLNLPRNQQGWGLLDVKNLLLTEDLYARK